MTKNEIKENYSVIIGKKMNKNWGINVNNEVLDIGTKKHETGWKKLAKQDISIWKDSPCSLIERFNIAKFIILPRVAYKLNALPINFKDVSL